MTTSSIEGVPARKLLQNAIKVKTRKGPIYLRSSSVHDYVSYGKGKNLHFVDGGLSYLHRTVGEESWDLYEDDSFETICARALWGSYGKDGKGPKVIKPLAECDFDHLCAIKATQPQIKGTMWGRVVDYWIKEKA